MIKKFLNSLLENPAILGSLEKYCLYDKDVFVTFIIFREEPLEENTEFVETLLHNTHAIQETESDISEVSFL